MPSSKASGGSGLALLFGVPVFCNRNLSKYIFSEELVCAVHCQYIQLHTQLSKFDKFDIRRCARIREMASVMQNFSTVCSDYMGFRGLQEVSALYAVRMCLFRGPPRN